MKNWLKKNIFSICTALSIFPFVYHIGSHSFVLFGEPDYPVED